MYKSPEQLDYLSNKVYIIVIMNDIQLHTPTTDDLNAMQGIWHSTFDSSDADLFFDFFYNHSLSLVSKHNNSTIAMGHLLPVGDLKINENDPIPTAMIYAVATLPEYRKLGLGSAISENLIQLARSAGYPAVVLCPAEDSLFNFYNKKTSMKEWFYTSEYKLSGPILAKSKMEFSEIYPDEYMRLREKLFQRAPHIRFNQHALEYQKRLCEIYGGGLYRISTPVGSSCAIIERQSSDSICIKELFIPTSISPSDYFEYIQNVAASAISKFSANECIIRTPVNSAQPHAPSSNIDYITKRFAMLSLPPELENIVNNTTSPPWYGLAFD